MAIEVKRAAHPHIFLFFPSTDATSTANAKNVRKETHRWQAQIYFNFDFYQVGRFQQENKHFQWIYFENH